MKNSRSTPPSVEDVVRRVIAEVLGRKAHEIQDQNPVRDVFGNGSLGADSLDTVEIVMALEDEYNFARPDEEWEKCITVADFVKLVKEGTS